MPIKSVKMKISKNKKMRFFLMAQGSLNPNIRKKSKNAYNKRKKENFEKQKKMQFFLMSQGSLNPKIRFLGQKSVPCSPRKDRRTDRHESDYYGHHFRVSGVFPSTYHQGSAKKKTKIRIH